MRIAILILMHKYSNQQKTLIDNLSTDFDLYIHIDKRTSIEKSGITGLNIHVYKTFKVYWGSYNQIRATTLLLEEANKKKYDRYLIISGEDIPVKSNKDIVKFFEGNNKEYFEYGELPKMSWGKDGGFEKIDFYYPNSLYRGNSNYFHRKINRKFVRINRKYIIPAMKKFGFRRRLDIKYYGGANWMNLTGNCVDQVIDYIKNNPDYVRSFRYTSCADEIFFQTIICNYIKGINSENNSLRYIDWTNCIDSPKILVKDDLEKIMESQALFARKFDQNVDNDVINELFRRINYA